MCVLIILVVICINLILNNENKHSTLTVLRVTSHSEIDTSQLRRLVEQATANVTRSETFFLVNSVYTNNVLNAGVHV